MEVAAALWYTSASKCPSARSSACWDAGEEVPLLGVSVFVGYRAGQDMLARPRTLGHSSGEDTLPQSALSTMRPTTGLWEARTPAAVGNSMVSAKITELKNTVRPALKLAAVQWEQHAMRFQALCACQFLTKLKCLWILQK